MGYGEYILVQVVQGKGGRLVALYASLSRVMYLSGPVAGGYGQPDRVLPVRISEGPI